MPETLLGGSGGLINSGKENGNHCAMQGSLGFSSGWLSK